MLRWQYLILYNLKYASVRTEFLRLAGRCMAPKEQVALCMWRSCWRNLQLYVLNASFQIIFSWGGGAVKKKINQPSQSCTSKKKHGFIFNGIGVETWEETVVVGRESPERTQISKCRIVCNLRFCTLLFKQP
jgi:hypothetical protein